MPKYLALLYDDPADWTGISPEEMQRIIQKYRAWNDRLAQKGRVIGGQKLIDGQGRVMRLRDGKLKVLDGPYSESKEVVGGYFALQAESYDEAVKLLSDCPHLQYKGTIEVREFDEKA